MDKYIVKDKNFYNKMFAIAIPMVLQNLINVAVGLLDTVMLGQLGEVALSASSLGGQLGFTCMIVNLGLTSGAAVLTSQYWGREDTESIRRTMSMTYKISLGISLIFIAIALLVPEFVLTIFTKDPRVIASGAGYLRAISLTYLFSGITMSTLNMLRTVGTVKISMYIYGVSFFVNVFFNYCMIFGRFGFPRWGVVGAAVATVIARFVEMCIAVYYLLKIDSKIHFSIKDLFNKIDRGIFKIYMEYGLPVLLNETLWSLGSSAVSVIIGHMGTAFVAANSICGVMFQCITVITQGLSSAAAVIAGNTIGEGKYQQAKQQSYTIFIMSIFAGLFSCTVALLLREPLISVYNITAETQLLAREMLTVLAFVCIFTAISSINMFGTLRGGGDSKFVAVMDVGTMWVLSVPLGWLTGIKLGMPVGVVFVALRSSGISLCFVAAARIMSGKWIKDVTRTGNEEINAE